MFNSFGLKSASVAVAYRLHLRTPYCRITKLHVLEGVSGHHLVHSEHRWLHSGCSSCPFANWRSPSTIPVFNTIMVFFSITYDQKLPYYNFCFFLSYYFTPLRMWLHFLYTIPFIEHIKTYFNLKKKEEKERVRGEGGEKIPAHFFYEYLLFQNISKNYESWRCKSIVVGSYSLCIFSSWLRIYFGRMNAVMIHHSPYFWCRAVLQGKIWEPVNVLSTWPQKDRC